MDVSVYANPKEGTVIPITQRKASLRSVMTVSLIFDELYKVCSWNTEPTQYACG